ncbi:MAG TPA: fumarylacetoacetate hydrolase family protein [Allosphingosinicella sp.]|nr:fumarylacetoacetate hydrolase family protein [Allosphingosinicella sp.]
MSFAGHIYGVVLNDKEERARLEPQFAEKPYAAPPKAPVVFMKPRGALSTHQVSVGAGKQLVASPTVALLFGRDATSVAPADVPGCIAAMALAVDFSLPQANYYRPSVSERSGDETLLLGSFVAPRLPDRIATFIDGREAHGWSLDRLVRPVDELVSELSAFLTLRAGDILMVGLPGDAPSVEAGQSIRVEATGLSAIEGSIREVSL